MRTLFLSILTLSSVLNATAQSYSSNKNSAHDFILTIRADDADARPIGSGLVIGYTSTEIWYAVPTHLINALSGPYVLEGPNNKIHVSPDAPLRALYSDRNIQIYRILCLDCRTFAILKTKDFLIHNYHSRNSLNLFNSAFYAIGCPDGICFGTFEPVQFVTDNETESLFRSPFVRPGYSGGLIVDEIGQIAGMVISQNGVHISTLKIDEVLRIADSIGSPEVADDLKFLGRRNMVNNRKPFTDISASLFPLFTFYKHLIPGVPNASVALGYARHPVKYLLKVSYISAWNFPRSIISKSSTAATKKSFSGITIEVGLESTIRLDHFDALNMSGETLVGFTFGYMAGDAIIPTARHDIDYQRGLWQLSSTRTVGEENGIVASLYLAESFDVSNRSSVVVSFGSRFLPIPKTRNSDLAYLRQPTSGSSTFSLQAPSPAYVFFLHIGYRRFH